MGVDGSGEDGDTDVTVTLNKSVEGRMIEDELSLKAVEDYIDNQDGVRDEERKPSNLKEEDEYLKCPGKTLGHDRSKKERSLDVQNTGEAAQYTFEDLELHPDILKGLKKAQFYVPSPIQMKAIPPGKFGYDLIMQSKSGTGKTCAFSVIVLHQLDLSTLETAREIQALILSPTREIAYQNKTAMKHIGSELHGLRIKVFIGGTSVLQSIKFSKVCNVVSGTPGRILHMIDENKMDLSKVKVLVLDEADRLMESSFMSDVMSIMEATPAEKQVIAASATYPDGLKDFVKRFMRNPMDITTDVVSNLLSVQLFAADVNKILELKKPVVQMDEIFQNQLLVIQEIIKHIPYTQAIIFSRYILKAQKIYEWCKDLSLDAALLTGALTQDVRLNSLREAQKGKCKILVASDLGTRGLDFEGVDLVINLEVPDDATTFIHRFGRAGRFGTSGISITLLSFYSDYNLLSERLSGSKLLIKKIENKSQIISLANGQTNFRRFNLQKDKISQSDKGNENWVAMLEKIMTEPLQYPSPQSETYTGFQLDVDISKIVRRAQEIKNKYRNS